MEYRLFTTIFFLTADYKNKFKKPVLGIILNTGFFGARINYMLNINLWN